MDRTPQRFSLAAFPFQERPSYRTLRRGIPGSDAGRAARLVRLAIVSAMAWFLLAPCAKALAGALDAGKVHHCKPGPWGNLEYSYMYLEMPLDLVSEFPRPQTSTRWYFPGGTHASLRSLFERAGLSPAYREELLKRAQQAPSEDVLVVTPPLDGLMAMTPEQRSVIYCELAASELNSYCVEPICIANGDVDEWFERSDLRPALREVVKKMAYMRGEMLCFSDLPTVFGMAESEQEERGILKAMSRTRSMVLRLGIKDRSELEQAKRYWSANERRPDVEPILISLAEMGAGERLDCVHLLPSLPRRCLYTYPGDARSAFGPTLDCHWTSFNFFNAAPVDYQFDVRFFSRFLATHYTPARPPCIYGDLIMFVGADGVAIHSCIYIADDIVYSKNGGSPAAPWLLMNLDDIKRCYSHLRPFGVQVYRLRPQGLHTRN